MREHRFSLDSERMRARQSAALLLTQIRRDVVTPPRQDRDAGRLSGARLMLSALNCTGSLYYTMAMHAYELAQQLKEAR